MEVGRDEGGERQRWGGAKVGVKVGRGEGGEG